MCGPLLTKFVPVISTWLLCTAVQAQPGSLDPLFNALGTGTNGTVHCVEIQADGKILVGGSFTEYNGAPVSNLARLQTNGALDASFNIGSGVNGTVHTIEVQPNGRILIGGAFSAVNGTARTRIARLLTDGTLDSGFVMVGLDAAQQRVQDIAVQASGKILVAQAGSLANDACGWPTLQRLLANGALDTAFPEPDICHNLDIGRLNTIEARPDGKFLVGGFFSAVNGSARPNYALFNEDGSLHAAFSSGQNLMEVFSLAVGADNKMYLSGTDNWTTSTMSHVLRCNADGTLDATWTAGTGPNGAVSAIALQPDGKLIIAGAFSSFNGTAVEQLARLSGTGALEPTFNPGTSPTSEVKSIAIEAHGNILLGGTINDYNGTTVGNVLRVLNCSPGQACDDGDPNTTNDALNTDCSCGSPIAGARLSLKALLEGPGITANGTMHDLLRAGGHVPLLEPYSANPSFAHVGPGGGETTTAAVLAASGTSAVVDWVFVELRAAADPTQVVATRSALLLRNGSVVDVDRVSPVFFDGIVGEMHVAVRHRNHLGAMTASTYQFGMFPVSIDLTGTTLPLFGTQAMKTQAAFNYLWAGNVIADGEIKYTGGNNDRDPILTAIGGTVPTATLAGYHAADVGMDAVVKYTGAGNDRDRILTNVGGVVPTAVRTEQLP